MAEGFPEGFCQAGEMLQAYIDESGVTGEAARSSKHFVLGAYIFDDANTQRAHDYLAELREGVGRRPGHLIHWNKIPSHGARRYLTQSLGDQDWLRLSTVVVCRDHIADSLPTPQVRYQFTLRLLLERLSWFAAAKGTQLHFTLSHWLGFQEEPFRAYEQFLWANPDRIKTRWLDPAGGTVANNEAVELLQIADVVASSTACAFEPDQWGYVEREYLHRALPRFYRYQPEDEAEAERLYAYGLKLQPNNASTLSGYEWVADLA